MIELWVYWIAIVLSKPVSFWKIFWLHGTVPNPYGQIHKGDNHTFRMFKDEGDELGTVPWSQKIFQNDTSHV